MGCGCGAKKVSPQQYVHTDPSGVKTTYNSKVEAIAATARKGGSWQPK